MSVNQVPPHHLGISPDFLHEKGQIKISTEEMARPPNEELDIFKHDGSHFLVQSPYTEQDHLLDLRTLDAENALLARALARMENLRPDYATASYVESFNWNEILQELERLVRTHGYRWKETSFFIVAFRSQIPPTTVYEDLGALDKVAHTEAIASGGFLK